MTDTKTVLKISNLSHSFKSQSVEFARVRENINVEVKKGDFVCVLGPSGCGKSTLLRCIAGLIKPSGGKVMINGVTVKEKPENVGFVFQEGPLFPWRSALLNTSFGLEIKRVNKNERREKAMRALELAGITPSEFDKRPYELSGGMQQRVAIAQALCPGPEIMLLDEPFTGLDEVTSWRLQNELVRIWSETGNTVIFVTHNIEDAVFMGRRVVVIGGKPGKVVKEIETDVKYPRDRTSKEFTNNLLRVREVFHRASRDFFIHGQ